MSHMTVNQHHVWQYHLKAWANKKDQVWCLQQGKLAPFPAHTSKIASERFFYEVLELSEADEQYLNWVINRSNDENLRKLNRGWVDALQTPFKLRKKLATLPLSEEGKAEVDRELIKIEKTLGEDYHGSMEQRGKPMLDCLREGEASFHRNDEQKQMTFIQFLCYKFFVLLKSATATTPYR